MNFVSLDLEMNQPSGRVIQVGIALGTAKQAPSDYVCRQWLVDPGEPVSEFITDLTGITDDALKSTSVPLTQVALELGQLIDLYSPFTNPVVWGEGDSRTLKQAFAEVGVSFPYFGHRTLDVKTMCTFLAFASNKSPPRGLKSALSRYELCFTGEPHRADADAANTLKLYFHLLGRQAGMEKAASSFF